MAWIQVHQQLKDHRKLLIAADDLEIEPAHMLGLLVSFWLWALDNAPSGSLAGITNRTISRAAQWSGDADLFVETITRAGLLDTENNELFIHDWHEYAGKLIDQREAEKNRSKCRRQAANRPIDDRRSTDKQPTVDQQTTGGRVDQSIVNQSIYTVGDLPPTPQEVIERKPELQEQRFDEFWQLYPKKIGKKAALASWKRLKPTTELFERIMQAVAFAKTSDQWKREGGRYIPNPMTWLNQGRWDDELTEVSSSTANNKKSGTTDTMGVLGSIIEDEEGGGYNDTF